MEIENSNKDNEAQILPLEERPSTNLNKVTPLSKYLAMVLFVIMPFVGGWIVYNNAPEKVVEVEQSVETQNVQIPAPSEEFSDFYTYRLPTGWYYTVKEFGGGMKEIVAPSPLKVKETYIDESGYYHDTSFGVFIQHFPAAHIFNENKTFMRWIWPGEYGTLLTAIYHPSSEIGEEALRSLDFRIFPATLFKTEDERFQGVSRINTKAQDYGFFARYELLLIDTLYGDIITLSIELDGKEINDIRSKLANKETDMTEFAKAQQAFLDLLNSKSRDELSFGYLMDDLEEFANSLEGINDRAPYSFDVQ